MSDVTFTPEQIREIRRRVEAASSHTVTSGGVLSLFEQGRFSGINMVSERLLAAFQLPKVTRYRTFTVTWNPPLAETYRVKADRVEARPLIVGDPWYSTNDVDSFAAELVKRKMWTALAAFADVCARPVEEVDA